MSNDVQFNFDDNFQLGIFELMMMDTSFCEKSVSLLKAEFFKNKYYAWFFDIQKDLIEEYGSAPTHLQVKNEIMRFAVEKRAVYLQVFERITKPQLKRDHNYIRRNLEHFVKKALRFQLNEILVNNQNKDADYLDKIIKEKVEQIEAVSFGKAQCQSLGQLDTIMKSSKEAMSDVIPTYMPTIDRALIGGIPRGTLTLGLSGTNVGKSIWLMNWTYHLIRNGYRVFYVNLEGYESQTILRLATRAIGCSYGDVRWDRLSDIQAQKKEEFVLKCKNNLQIFHNSTFGFTIEDLVPIIRQKKEEFNFDVLMVDYGQILNSKKKFTDLRHEQAYVHRGLSSIAGELDIAAVTVAQGNRETQEKNSKGKSLVRMGDISECFEIVRACATVLTLNRSEKDIEMDTARVLLDKSRDGKTNVIEVMKTNFSRMAFYGDKEEGLGFMQMDDYIHAAAQSKE